MARLSRLMTIIIVHSTKELSIYRSGFTAGPLDQVTRTMPEARRSIAHLHAAAKSHALHSEYEAGSRRKGARARNRKCRLRAKTVSFTLFEA